jgi:hypothetical protein
MAIRHLSDDLGIIEALGDEPNDEDGLSAVALKAKFDEGGKRIQEYLNATLIPDVETEIYDAVDAAGQAQGNMPRGGAAGQVLFKASDGDYDAQFRDVLELVSSTSIPAPDEVSGRLGLGEAAMLSDALMSLSNAAVWRGVSANAGGEAEKQVALPSFALAHGAAVIVSFTNANTAASPTLNVNGTGAVPIAFEDNAPVTNAALPALYANAPYLFVYDGAYWRMGYAHAQYKTFSGAFTTPSAAGTTADIELGFTPRLIAVSYNTSASAALGWSGLLVCPESGQSSPFRFFYVSAWLSATWTILDTGFQVGVENTTKGLYVRFFALGI